MPKKLNRGQIGLLSIIITTSIILDQISKLLIRNNLVLGQSIPPTGIIRLTYVTNTGCAFGFFQNQSDILAIVNITIIIGIIAMLYFLSINNHVGIISAGLIIGGAIGNLIDRLSYGYIIDFIDVKLWNNYHWPVFNIADSSIVIGSFLLALSLYLLHRQVESNAS
jgi:signal peptidase II